MTKDIPLHRWQPRAVIFDWDGTLADTKSAWAMAKRRIFARRDRTLGQGVLTATHGLHPTQSARILAEALDDDPQLIEAELTEFATANLAVAVPEMPGAFALVERLARRLPTVVVSNSPRHALAEGLRHTRFEFQPEQVICADEVGAPKPDPTLYLEACRRLGQDPSDVLAFEDSAAGVRSALDAGLRVVAVSRSETDNTNPRVSAKTGADLTLTSLLDPELQDLVDLWVPLDVSIGQASS